MARNLILCCILAALLYKEAAATGGGYAAEGTYAVIYSKNTWVESKYTVYNVAPGMKITSVFWTYSPSYIPPGFKAILCWNNKSTCLDITRSGSGSTFTHFTGLSATLPFSMYFQVESSRPLNGPVNMSNLRISVNYDV